MEQDPDYWAKIVQEQLSRPPERRCPIAKASNEVTDLLSEHWAIYAPGCKLIFALAISLHRSSCYELASRLDIDNIPAVLPQHLQGSLARAAILPQNVERERLLNR